MREPIQLVWLKRDLRWEDHDALAEAFRASHRSIIFFCFEDLIKDSPDFGWRHWQAQYHSLQEMNARLQDMGHQLLLVQGNVLNFLQHVVSHLPVSKLISHKEHGIQITYDRDKAIAKWLKSCHIPWQELDHNGVQRGRKNREAWDEAWRDYMQKSLSPSKPSKEVLYAWQDDSELVALIEDFRLKPELIQSLAPWNPNFVSVGEKAAQVRLQNFLQEAQNLY